MLREIFYLWENQLFRPQKRRMRPIFTTFELKIREIEGKRIKNSPDEGKLWERVEEKDIRKVKGPRIHKLEALRQSFSCSSCCGLHKTSPLPLQCHVHESHRSCTNPIATVRTTLFRKSRSSNKTNQKPRMR